jgi:hypothetical protein
MMHPEITMMYGRERRGQMLAAADRQRLARRATLTHRTQGARRLAGHDFLRLAGAGTV